MRFKVLLSILIVSVSVSCFGADIVTTNLRATNATITNGKFNNISTVTFKTTDLITGGPWVDVRAFGAVCDGATDDTAAVASAAASGGNIQFPPGVCRGNFSFTTFTKVRGAGVGITKLIPYNTALPVVTVTKTATSYPYIAGFGFSISDLVIDGGQDRVAADPAHVDTTYTGNHGIHLNAGTASGEPNSSIGNINISNVIITACGGHGIYADGRGPSPNGSIYAQVAWLKIDNSVITWNQGVGVLLEGVVHQTQITGGTLIEKNSRGCPKVAFDSVLNTRAQVLYKNYGSTVGFPAKHTIDGSTTIQAGDDTFTTLAGSNAVGISAYGVQSLTIRDSWLESSDEAIWVSSTVTNGLNIKDNYIAHNETCGIVLHAGKGINIEGNEFTQASSGIGTYANPSNTAGLLNVSWNNNTYTNITTKRNVSATAVSAGFKFNDEGEQAQYAKSYAPGSTVTIDLSLARVNFVDLSQNTAVTLSNPTIGEEYIIHFYQTTAGNSVTWTGNTIHWGTDNDTAPIITKDQFSGDAVRLVYRTNGVFYEVGRTGILPEIGFGRSAYTSFSLNTAAGVAKGFVSKSAGLNRWEIQTDSTAEAGANAGSDFKIFRYNDDGTFLGTPLSITRSTGNATFNGTVSASGGSTNHGVCWKSTGALGYCSTVLAADGTCTCN